MEPVLKKTKYFLIRYNFINQGKWRLQTAILNQLNTTPYSVTNIANARSRTVQLIKDGRLRSSL